MKRHRKTDLLKSSNSFAMRESSKLCRIRQSTGSLGISAKPIVCRWLFDAILLACLRKSQWFEVCNLLHDRKHSTAVFPTSSNFKKLHSSPIPPGSAKAMIIPLFETDLGNLRNDLRWLPLARLVQYVVGKGSPRTERRHGGTHIIIKWCGYSKILAAFIVLGTLPYSVFRLLEVRLRTLVSFLCDLQNGC